MYKGWFFYASHFLKLVYSQYRTNNLFYERCYMKGIKTLLDKFDFSATIDQDTLAHVLKFLFNARERDIIKCRIGLGIDNRLTLIQTARRFHTVPDTVIAVEYRLAMFLVRNGVPVRDEVKKAREEARRKRSWPH